MVERTPRGLTRYLDLPDALQARSLNARTPREWRIHFHVPLYHRRLGSLGTTQDYVGELLDATMANSPCRHWEVETYSWGVLPGSGKRRGVVDSIADELRWVLRRVKL